MSDAATSPEPDTPPPTRVFLSYSRKDEAFMHRLAAALHKRGYAPDFDQSDYDPDNISGGISAEDEWWQRLELMIVAADVMVFIVSPDSAASKVCDEEIAVAREVGKRLIAVECRPINYAEAPPRLAAQNVKIKFTVDGEDRFHDAVDALSAVINVDIAWHRENRRLTELAIKWDGESRPDDRVLSAADIRAAEAHFERRARNADQPAEVLVDFLDHSRTKRDEEHKRLRRTIGRAFVKPADEALMRGRHEQALRLAAAGALLSQDMKFELVPELWPIVREAAISSKLRYSLVGHAGIATCAVPGSDGKLIVTAAHDDTARVWDIETGKQLAVVNADVGFSGPDDEQFAFIGINLNERTDTFITFSEQFFEEMPIKEWSLHTGRLISDAWTAEQIESKFDCEGSSDAIDLKRGDGGLLRNGTLRFKGDLRLIDNVRDAIVAEVSIPEGHHFSEYRADAGLIVFRDDAGGNLTIAVGACPPPTLNRNFESLRTSLGLRPSILWEERNFQTGKYEPMDGFRVVDPITEEELWRAFSDSPTIDASLSPDLSLVVRLTGFGEVEIWRLGCQDKLHTVNVGEDCSEVGIDSSNRYLICSTERRSVLIVDVSRETISVEPSFLLAAALSGGCGTLTYSEKRDLLMQDAPDDLFAEALRQLGRSANDPELQEVIAALHAPLHDNCYLSPTQFAEKFGLERPMRPDSARPTTSIAADTEDSDDPDEANLPPVIPRHPVTAEDLAGQTFVETHRGVAIFRLADGRYHVINNFAVATLDDARAAAEEVSGAGKVA